MTRRLSCLTLVLFATGCASGLAHTKVVAPTVVAKVAGLDPLGELTSIKQAGDVLYVAGQSGVAAVNAQGRVLWTLPLPPATFRLVDGDSSGAAFSAFDLVDVDRATGLKSFILGNEGDTPAYANQRAGAVSADGKLIWSIDLGGKAPASRPGLSRDQVAISRGAQLEGYSRATGAKAFTASLGSESLSFESQLLQASFNQPLFKDGAWYAAHLNHFTKTLPDGTVESNSIKNGLFSPFMNITSNLLPLNDGVVFGNSPWDGKKDRLFAADKGGGIDWDTYVDDKYTGVSALSTNGSMLFAATNFRVTAYNFKGSDKWVAVNGKGGLYPGRARGVRYIGNSFARTFAVRKSQTQQMVADEKNVYVTSSLNKADVITVLDAATGAYVDTLDVQAFIAELALVGPNLAVATDEGLLLIAPQ